MRVRFFKISPQKQKKCLFWGIYHFRGGGEISPPLGPWSKEWTSDQEGLKDSALKNYGNADPCLA